MWGIIYITKTSLSRQHGILPNALCQESATYLKGLHQVVVFFPEIEIKICLVKIHQNPGHVATPCKSSSDGTSVLYETMVSSTIYI